jgi:hypothetical protein
MASSGPAGPISGTAGMPQIADMPGRVAAQAFELWQLFSKADQPRPGREAPDLPRFSLYDARHQGAGGHEALRHQ